MNSVAKSGSLFLLVMLGLACSAPTEDNSMTSDLVQAGIHILQDTINYNITQYSISDNETQFFENGTMCDIMKEYSMLHYILTNQDEQDLNTAALLFVTQLHLHTACEREKTNSSRCADGQYTTTTGSGEEPTSFVNCSSIPSISQYCINSNFIINVNGTVLIGDQPFSDDLYTPWLRQFLRTMRPGENETNLLSEVLLSTRWYCIISPVERASCSLITQDR